MRCKVGDLCVIVRSNNGNEGRLVEVVGTSPYGPGYWMCEAMSVATAVPFPGGQRKPVPAGHRASIMDYRLRPIRDKPGEDETLTWKERETA